MRVLTGVETPPLRPTTLDLAVRHLLADERERCGTDPVITPVEEAMGIPLVFPLRVVAGEIARTRVVNRRVDGRFVISWPQADVAAPQDPAVIARLDEHLDADIVPLITGGAGTTDAGARWLVDHIYAFDVQGVAYLTYAEFELDLRRRGMTFGPGFGAIERRLAQEPLVLDVAPVVGRHVLYAAGDTIVTNPHFIVREMRYAIDFLPLDAGSRTVIAPAGGQVVAAVDGHADDLPRRDPARGAHPFGNYACVRSGGYDFSFAHLARGSVRVRAGDTVAVGDVLGEIGDSGRSAEPHLHFHVSTSDDVPHGVPLRFHANGAVWEPRRGAAVEQAPVGRR